MGGSMSPHCWTVHRWSRSARLIRATRGPVSSMTLRFIGRSRAYVFYARLSRLVLVPFQQDPSPDPDTTCGSCCSFLRGIRQEHHASPEILFFPCVSRWRSIEHGFDHLVLRILFSSIRSG